jgi:membrane protein
MATAAHPNQAAADANKGRSADKPTDIPAPGWKEILLRTWKEAGNDNIGIVAAGVAFYGFLALVPLLGATVLIYGLVAEPQTVLQHASSLTNMLPDDVAQLISQQLMTVVQTSGGKKGLGLAIALAISLWGARNAAGSVVTALNIAYEEEEKRGFLKTTLLAIAMTIGAVLLAIMAGGAIGMLGYLQHLFPDLGPVGAFFWRVLTYLLLGAVAAAAAATLFRYGPSREKAQWAWLTPGSLTFAIAWIVLTLAFGFYVSRFGNYGATYGSLSAIVVLLTWLYLSAYVLLFAAELNSELEHQTEKDTTTAGEKPLGSRGAWSADHVAAGTTEPDAPKEGDDARAEPQAPASGSSGGTRGARAGGAPAASAAGDGDEDGHPFLTSRLTNRAGRLAGTAKVGMIGSALATLGLGFLRRRGREGTGAALLAAAAGLALLKRK